MTDSETTVASASELNSELRDLLQRAHSNGIDVEGGWACRNGNGVDIPDWDVVVTEVEKKTE